MTGKGERNRRRRGPTATLLLLSSLCRRAVGASFVPGGARPRPVPSRPEGPRAATASMPDAPPDGDGGTGPSVGRYRHKGRGLTYLHQPASPGREGDRPVVLIHPVGIGLSSWFWKRVMASYAGDDGEGNPPLYAPDLIGCGLDHGADPWVPEEGGLFFPLSWAEGVEALMNDVIFPRREEARSAAASPLSPLSRLFGGEGDDDATDDGGCLVIAQGGLAPLGILLAHRNPERVSTLMLASPPRHEEVANAVPEAELRRNYDFLRSPVWGRLAFSLLESRAVVAFFSDLFLFEDGCDAEWLDEAVRESRVEARPPVQAFNAGLLRHRSFAPEMRELSQRVLIVSGEGDKRAEGRRPYEDALGRCALRTIGGCNVLPWESPAGIVELIRELGY